MKRPLSQYRPIGPFASFDNTLSSYGPESNTLRRKVYEMLNSMPQWSKDSDSFVDKMLDDYKDKIIELSKSTRDTGHEHSISVCFDGDKTFVTDIKEGWPGVAPANKCGGNVVRLADVHTHPVGEQANPSVTDVNSLSLGVSGIPLEFNEMIINPQKPSVYVEALGTNFNVYDFEARCTAHEITQVHQDEDDVAKAESMIRAELIADHGTQFEIES